MKTYIFSLLIVILIFSLNACNEDEEVHPNVKTISAVAESASTIRAEGKVSVWGSLEVVEYGFAVSQYENLSSNLKHYQVGTSTTQVNFSGTFSIAEFVYNNYSNKLSVWSYITNAKGTIYGNKIDVIIPQIQLSSFSPAYGKAGDDIRIYGANFSTLAGENKVFFNQTEAEVKNFSASQLLVEVPKNISYSYSYNYNPKIKVMVGDREAIFNNEFYVVPSITSFEPKSGTINTFVTFYGDNIRDGYYGHDFKVNFGGIITSVNSVSNGVITARIPREVNKINLPVTVIMYGHSQQLEDHFTILDPDITSIAPNKGIPGNEVYLYGNNFVDDNYYNPPYYQIFFNDIPANDIHTNSNSIRVSVPYGLDPGLYTIKVLSNLHEFTANQQFEIPFPEIVSMTPQKGAAGTYVRITGRYLADNCQVIFTDLSPIDIHNWQSDLLEFNIPSGLPKGENEFAIKSGNTVINSPIKFFNEGVTINSFSPAQGNAGTLVTILGTGFISPSVYFNDVVGNIISYNYGQIVVSVPQMESGDVKIAVRSYDEIFITSQNFKILP